MRIHDFGKLPVVYQGRIKPFDTLARNTLRVISNKETVDDFTKYEEGKRRQPQIPAVRWLLDVMAGAPESNKHRVFRIDNLDVLETLGLPRRKGFRYALEEFQGKIPVLEAQLKETYELEEESRSFYQRKLIEVERRLRAARLIEVAFSRVIPPLPSQEMVESDQEAAGERITVIQRMLRNLPLLESELNRFQPPLAVPVASNEKDADGESKHWVAFSTAWNQKFGSDLKKQFEGVDMGIEGLDPSKAADLWDEMLLAYADGNTKTFNDSVAEYEKLLADETPENLDQAKVGFENFFNYSQPFKYCLVMYIHFVLAGRYRLGRFGSWQFCSYQSSRVLVARLHLCSPYACSRSSSVHFWSTTDHESIFIGRLHWLGGCWSWAHLGVALWASEVRNRDGNR